LSHYRPGPTTRTTMQDENRLSMRITTEFIIQLMDFGYLKKTGFIRFNRRPQTRSNFRFVQGPVTAA